MTRSGTARRLAVCLVVTLAVSTPGSTARGAGQAGAEAPTAGPPEVVAEMPGYPAESTFQGQLALGPGTSAVAAWYEPLAPTSQGTGRLVVATRALDGTWSGVEPVTGFSELDGRSFEVAAGPAGAAVLAWTQPHGDRTGVHLTWQDGGEWATPTFLGEGHAPAVAVGGSENAVVTWTAYDGSVRVLTRVAGDGWAPPRVFRGGRAGSVPAVNAAGDAVVLWVDADSNRIRAAYRPRGTTTWTRPVSVAAPPYLSGAPAAVTVDRTGRVLAAWMRRDDVFWFRRTRAGSWSRVHQVPGYVGRMGEYGWIGMAVNRHGRALARWEADSGGTFAARYRPGSGFGRATPLSGGQFGFTGVDERPLLTGDGVAVVPGTSGDELALRWKPPGEPWSPVQSVADVDDVLWTDSRGRTSAVLVWAAGSLSVVLIRVPTAD